MNRNLPRCACGCGAIITRSGRTGPMPQYAGPACRKRAERRRRAAAVELPARAMAAPVGPPNTPVDDQVERALMEARSIGFAFTRLGGLARPEIAWRCTKLGHAITDAIGEHFGKDIL